MYTEHLTDAVAAAAWELACRQIESAMQMDRSSTREARTGQAAAFRLRARYTMQEDIEGKLTPEQQSELQELRETWTAITRHLPKRRRREVPTFDNWREENARLRATGQEPLTLLAFIRIERERLQLPTRTARALLRARQGLPTRKPRAARCKAGLHRMEGDNVRTRADGRQECRECAAIARRKRSANGRPTCPHCGEPREGDTARFTHLRNRKNPKVTPVWRCVGGCGKVYDMTKEEQRTYWTHTHHRGPYWPNEKAAARGVGWEG